MAAAATPDTPAPKKSSLVIQIGLLLLLTAGAVGGGWVSGSMLGPQHGIDAQHVAAGANGGDHDNTEEADEPGSAALAEQLNVFLLEDVTTNLAAPTETWIRMAVALVFAGPPEPQVAELVHQDFLAYLRTVKAQQIEGPSGFQHLRSDLQERAILRSEGRVKQILIRTLLLE